MSPRKALICAISPIAFLIASPLLHATSINDLPYGGPTATDPGPKITGPRHTPHAAARAHTQQPRLYSGTCTNACTITCTRAQKTL